MSSRVVFVFCEDCGGRGFLAIRVVPFFTAVGGCAGGGAVRCTCAGGFRAVLRRKAVQRDRRGP